MEGHSTENNNLSQKRFDTDLFREHIHPIRSESEYLMTSFFDNQSDNIAVMFDLEGKFFMRKTYSSEESLGFSFKEQLTEEEEEDLKNFITYAAPRIVVGALHSPAFYDDVKKTGNLSKSFGTFLKKENNGFPLVGHDAMHAMLAYMQSQGKSLIPAFMGEALIEDDGYTESEAANLEEAYVKFFSHLDDAVTSIKREIDRGKKGEELVLAAFERWEDKIILEFDDVGLFLTNEYAHKNRMPEMIAVMRNLVAQVESGQVNPKFTLHEFQRVLAPLLQRLRDKN